MWKWPKFLTGQHEPHKKEPFPKARNLVTDLLYEARRKQCIHVVFTADITEFQAWRASAEKEACSITSYVLACFARVISEHPEMQACRTAFGGSLITFNDVDVASTVEKIVDGKAVAWGLIVRDAGRLPVQKIDATIAQAKASSVEHSPDWRLEKWLMRQPRFIRRLIWLGPRISPHLKKHFLGTVAVTAVGMFSKTDLTLLPLSPMTLTLAIGGIDEKLKREGSEVVARSVISLCLCADHDIIDGAPLTRFADVLSDRIADPAAVLGTRTFLGVE